MARKKLLTLQEKAERELQVFIEQSEARHKIAQRVYDHQDKDTKHSIDVMVDRIVSISRGVVSVKLKGEKERVAISVPKEQIRQNALYLATEILKDLAMLDIRIAGFQFDAKFCADCGKPVGVKKKVKA